MSGKAHFSAIIRCCTTSYISPSFPTIVISSNIALIMKSCEPCLLDGRDDGKCGHGKEEHLPLSGEK